jgi:hypothetical protein
MLDWLPAALKGVDTADKTGRTISRLLQGRRGANRELLDEVRHNAGVCWCFLDAEADLERSVAALRHAVYDRLAAAGHDFNTLAKATIAPAPSLARSELQSLQGKRTEDLLAAIYDRIKALRLAHELGARPIRYTARFRNIQRRILLLLRHVAG